ncbi:sigma-70 family RNA polymerase sigma factor [Paenibacillaceae bacterium]|nr:sigma-70 family RNA polymerase sigma factor [Paenibacillaceae bacterium]
MRPLYDDEQLLEAALKTREHGAFEHVMEQYSRLLWVIVAGIIGTVAPRQDIEDCVADVFFQLWSQPEHFNSSRGNLKSYLSLLARHKAIDRYRKLSRQPTMNWDESILAEDIDFLAQIEQQDNRTELYNAVAHLKEPDREIIIRRFFYEEKPADTARRLGLPLREIGNRIYRSKLKLKQFLLGTEQKHEVK